MRRWIQRILVIAVLAALATWAGRRMLVTAPVPVTVFRVEVGRVESTVTNSQAGTVRTRRRARLSPEIGGRIVEIPARAGDTVEAGDVLLRIDDGDLSASRVLAQRDLEASQASKKESCLARDFAQREWQRQRDLFAEGIISANSLDRLDSQHKRQAAACTAAGAAVQRARAALRVAEARLRKTVLRAPFSGVVADVFSELGEYVSPSPPGVPVPPVLDLIQPGSIYISAPMDEVDAERVRAGLRVRVTLDPFPGREFYGTLTRVAPFVLDVEEQNRTFEVEAELENKDLAMRLMPGTSADIEVILDAVDHVLRIPAYALLADTHVLVVEDGKLVSRPVETGRSNWEYVEVTSGLVEDEPVVVSLDRPEVIAGAPAFIERELAHD
ncbi:MAG: efflux RND transporter periplasmic adaptor subunit [Acidobacteriota bacterium]